MNPEFNVLSLFDGISCGQVALERAGISVTKYYAAEIDQRAVKVTQRNWPKTIQYGDVTKIRKEHFMSPIHLLMGGSPCQGFSFAGKQLNFDDPRSKLFFEFVRLKNELNPKYFFLENVRMVKASQDVISDMLGVQPIFVNSALVSAQNRQRLYWTNIPGFVLPQDRGILIKHILQDDNFLYVRDRISKNIFKIRHIEKSVVLTATYNKGLDNNHARPFVMQINPCKKTGGKQPLMQDRVYDKNYKSAALTSFSDRMQVGDNMENYRILTPIECERLQGLPDDYTKCVSTSARYHALGNGWQVDTIVEFFKYIKP